jgi:hypothetical protein
VVKLVPGFEADFWTGIGAPKGTPVEIVGSCHSWDVPTAVIG